MVIENQQKIATKNPNIYWGWWIVLAIMITFTLSYGSRNAFSVFLKPLSQQFGWSRGATSLAFTINLWVYAASAPLFGWLLDKYGPKPLMLFGTIVTVISYCLVSTANSLWELYLYYGVLGGIAFNPLGMMLGNAMIVLWFKSKRGMAMGLAQSGMGLGGMIFIPLAGFLLNIYGWRASYIALGVLMIVVMIPVILLLIKHKPESIGLKVYGEDEPTIVADRKQEIARTKDWEPKAAYKTFTFWAVWVSFILYSTALYVMLSQQVAFATDIGFKPLQAAAILGVVGMTAIIGRVGGGALSDIMDRRYTVLLAILVQTLGIGICLFMLANKISAPIYLYVYSALFGIGYGACTPLFPALVGDLFGRRYIGAIYGVVTVAGSIGAGLGPFLGGILFDIYKSYWVAYWVTIAIYIAAAIAMISVRAINKSDDALGKINNIKEDSNNEVSR